MPSKKNLGRALREVRQHFGLSQDDFAFASSRTFVSSIERGIKSPTIEKLSQLAQVMDTEAAVVVLVATMRDKNAQTKAGIANELRKIFELVEEIAGPTKSASRTIRMPGFEDGQPTESSR